MPSRSRIFRLLTAVLLAGALAGCASRKPSHTPTASTPPVTILPGVETVGQPEVATEHPVVAEARRWIGTPYRYGGTSRQGADCSGMVMEVVRQSVGITLPRNSLRQCEACRPVSLEVVRPGDLVFFRSARSGGKVCHVGIYSGNGRFIHASSSKGVIESRLAENYYATHFHGAGRYLPDGDFPPPPPPLPPAAAAPLPEPPPLPSPSEDIEEYTPLSPITAPPEPEAPAQPDSISAQVRNAFIW